MFRGEPHHGQLIATWRRQHYHATYGDFSRLRLGISNPKITATGGAISHAIRSAARVTFRAHLHGCTSLRGEACYEFFKREAGAYIAGTHFAPFVVIP
jgi:hypothetical protein